MLNIITTESDFFWTVMCEWLFLVIDDRTIKFQEGMLTRDMQVRLSRNFR